MNDANQEVVDVLDMFFSGAKECPRIAAVDDADGEASYEELMSLACRVAGTLGSVTENPCPRVLIALAPSRRAYAAMIGSLVAGGTFCPVDLVGPEGRNATICKAFAPDVVFFERTVPPFLSALPLTTPRVDLLKQLRQVEARPSPERSDVAYVVFTSGSTGRPKGVKMGRRGFSHFLGVAKTYFGLSPGERWGQFSNLGHDLGVMDVFMAVTQGGTLVPLSDAERHIRQAVAIRDRRLGVWQSVPGILEFMIRANQLTAEHLAPLRVMSFCGDTLHARHLDALFSARPDLHVFNTYGTTETTGFNTLNHLTSGNFRGSCDAGSVAIGEDVPGWRIHLRGGDSADEGQIVVASECLSLGYWRDEERTRAAFRQVQFGDRPPQRCYFTGDWGIRRNGRLYCTGRMDRQVKIQGERIELEEVDGLLREAGFSDAYTVIKDGELHAFVESTQPIDQEQIRYHLKKSLPFQAIPRAIHALPSLPRNQNGKIDREIILHRVSS